MNARASLIVALVMAAFAAMPVRADAFVQPTVSTSTNENYSQVSSTSADPLAVVDSLQLATDTREQLTPLLQLGPKWRFPVHLHIITADDPLASKIYREATATYLQDNTMKIEAVLPASDPNARDFIQRQFVTAILWEKFFASTTTFTKDTKLDSVPFWLIEGLCEKLNDDTEHDRESIVRRAVQNQTEPTLAQITDWKELSKDRLLGLWQRAFCFYLVDSLTKTDARKADLQLWLSGASDSNSTAQLHFPTETAWQHELADATSRSHAIVYTWDETQAELDANQTITYATSKKGTVVTCTLDTVLAQPRTTPLLEALKERLNILTQLELRAHPGWHDILETYRSALSETIAENSPLQAKKLFLQAHQMRVAESERHQKVLDYINWFEVTKDYSGDATHFRDYFNTAREMERIQADPAHPNPIRANLLQIESEL